MCLDKNLLDYHVLRMLCYWDERDCYETQCGLSVTGGKNLLAHACVQTMDTFKAYHELLVR